MLMEVDRLDIVLLIVGVVKRVMSLVVSVIDDVMVAVLVMTHNRLVMPDYRCPVHNWLLMVDSLDNVALLLLLVMLGNDVANSFMADWLVSHSLLSVGNLVLVDVLMDLSVVRHDLLLIMTLAVESSLVNSVFVVVNRLDIVLVVVVVVEGTVGLMALMHDLVVMHNLVVTHDSLVVMNLLVARD